MHKMNIAPEWEYTKSSTNAWASFSFHSSKNCPGYRMTISNWSLRKCTSDINQAHKMPDLVYDAHKELERVLGKSVFINLNCAEDKLRERLKKLSAPQSLAEAMHNDSSEQEQIEQEITHALVKDYFLTPEIARLSIPLFTLSMQNKTPYCVENAPWPMETPPPQIIHLAKSGFNSRLEFGILASAHDSERFWIISSFTPCKVETTLNRKNAVISEFLGLKDIIVASLENIIEHKIRPMRDDIAKIDKSVENVRVNTEAIAKNEYDLRKENAALRELAEGGFLRFATRVEADDFRAFATIILTGNRNQAAQALKKPQRSFYDLVESWTSRGPDYKRMYHMVEWRKKTGRKIKVRLDDSLLGTEVEDQAENPETKSDVLAAMRDKTDTKNRDDLLRDILQAIASQNVKNWQAVQAEVVEILKEEVSQ